MLADLLNRLSGVRPQGTNKFKALCPVHEENTPSLSIRELDDGRVLLYCFGCGAGAVEIIRATGLDPNDVFPPRTDDEKGYAPIRKRIDMEQAVLALRDEVYFLQATQYWLASGRELTTDYQTKLEESSTRIDGVCLALGIMNDNKAMGRLLNRWLSNA